MFPSTCPSGSWRAEPEENQHNIATFLIVFKKGRLSFSTMESWCHFCKPGECKGIREHKGIWLLEFIDQDNFASSLTVSLLLYEGFIFSTEHWARLRIQPFPKLCHA